MNEFFYNSFNKSSSDITSFQNMPGPSRDDNVLSEVEIDIGTVNSVMKTLPNNWNKTSEDADGFSYAILKGGGEVLAHQLCRLFKLSFANGLVPSDWKQSVIFPIKKKTSAVKVEDY